MKTKALEIFDSELYQGELTTIDAEMDTKIDGIEAIITDEELKERVEMLIDSTRDSSFKRWLNAYTSLVHIVD